MISSPSSSSPTVAQKAARRPSRAHATMARGDLPAAEAIALERAQLAAQRARLQRRHDPHFVDGALAESDDVELAPLAASALSRDPYYSHGMSSTQPIGPSRPAISPRRAALPAPQKAGAADAATRAAADEILMRTGVDPLVVWLTAGAVLLFVAVVWFGLR